jgi:hypothetical protein
MKLCHLQVNRTRDHHVKQSKPVSQRQRLTVFPHIWKLDIWRERKEREREKSTVRVNLPVGTIGRWERKREW